MSLAEWVINKSDPSTIESGVYTITSILGTGSLRIRDNDTTNLNMYSTLYAAGLTRGRMRMLLRITYMDDSDTQRTGFYFHTDDQDLASGTPTFYSAHVVLDTNTSARRYALGYYTGGVAGAETIFYLSDPISVMTDAVSVLPLEVEWQYESEFDGVRVVLRGSLDGSDTDTDFTNLSVLSTIILVNPLYVLPTSSGEGVYYYGGTSPSGSEIEYDSVSIFSLDPS